MLTMSERLMRLMVAITLVVPHMYQAESAELVYRVTIRDFLPAMCVNNNEAIAAWNATWGNSVEQLDWRVNTVLNTTYASVCPFPDLIASGDLIAHLDFQAENIQGGFPMNTGRDIEWSSPLWDAHLDEGFISHIVTNTLKQYDQSGLYKPEYGCEVSENGRCGVNLKPTERQLGARPSTAGPEYFNTWYKDDRKINRRIGAKLRLVDEENTGTFSYSSEDFYDPIRHVPHVAASETDPDNALRWDKRGVVEAYVGADPCPGEICNAESNLPFFLTTELHTFFQYRGGESFRFSGDDDIWIYINDRLAIDLGGFHPEVSGTISLDKNAAYFGLEVNGTYSLQLFHAERHTFGSNFRITSTLVSACNVLQSGLPSINTFYSNGTVVNWVSSIGAFVETSGNEAEGGDVLVLTDGSKTSTSEFIYHPTQHNIGAGFELEFQFEFPAKRASDSDGFALVMHSATNGLDDMPTSTSGNLGFRFLDKSFAVALDMCVSRPNCVQGEQLLSLHYVKEGSKLNDASDRTRQRSVMVPNPLNKGDKHTMYVVYYENPSWLEIYIDDSLYIVDKEFDALAILGGRDAYVGFTTGTSTNYASPIKVSNLKMDTVGVSVPETTATGYLTDDPSDADFFDSEKPLVTVNGVDEAMYTISTFDFCGNQMDGGGLAALVDAALVVVPDVPKERRLNQGNGTSENEEYGDLWFPATRMIDNLDGTYSVVFVSTELAPHDLFIRFGNECEDGNAFEAYAENLALRANGKACWTARFDDVLDTQLQPTASPTVNGFSAETLAPTPALRDDSDLFLGLGVGGASLIGVCIMSVCIGFFYRRRWNKNQAYIEKGKWNALEDGVESAEAIEMQQLVEQYQQVKQKLAHARARGNNNGVHENNIGRTEAEMTSIKALILDLKKKRQESDLENSSPSSIYGGSPPLRTRFGSFALGASLKNLTRTDSTIKEKGPGPSKHNRVSSMFSKSTYSQPPSSSGSQGSRDNYNESASKVLGYELDDDDV